MRTSWFVPDEDERSGGSRSTEMREVTLVE